MMDEGLFQENERLTPQAGSRHVTGLGPFELESGARLENADLAWESWGTLNESRDNAVLICHALSGDSHAAGWWSRMVGPGRAIDPAEHFILCSNVLGGCQGSTGPGTLDSDGVRLGSRFPFPSIGDMVRAQAILLDRLSIPRLRMAAGGSMGGMQVLEWAVRFPDRLDRAWVTASCGAHSPMQIGFNETARQAVLRDPKWRGGDFP
ncbi:MAG: alpha/beta fold hydrolase, partial [Fimbriimonadaceae bacterium]|nr:alpha/beta fold hydrolase [Fimbriimonadaceae bacterium]